MIEMQKAELSLEMDVYSSLWYVFHGMVCGYLATSHKLKKFKIMEHQPQIQGSSALIMWQPVSDSILRKHGLVVKECKTVLIPSPI